MRNYIEEVNVKTKVEWKLRQRKKVFQIGNEVIIYLSEVRFLADAVSLKTEYGLYKIIQKIK